MADNKFEKLISSVSDGSNGKKRCAVAVPRSRNVMEAVLKATGEGTLECVLFGNPDEMASAFEEFEGLEIVACESDREAAFKAVESVRNGECDFIMKGSLETATLLKEVVDKETGIGKSVDGCAAGVKSTGAGGVMFHMMLVEIPSYHKIIGVTDGGMIIAPTLEQKVSMVREAAEMFRKLGVARPRIACLAAVEKVNPKMPETEDGAALKAMALAGEFGPCDVEGPISTDLAFSRSAAAVKGYESPVTGDVDIVLVPNIAAGNIMVKALVEFAGAKTAGCILGARVPIALTSRGATAEEEYNALMLAAAQA